MKSLNESGSCSVTGPRKEKNRGEPAQHSEPDRLDPSEGGAAAGEAACLKLPV